MFTLDAKLKLKSDTFFLETEQGIYFKNNHGSFRIQGKHIYAWFDKIAPMLDGNQSFEDISRSLPIAARNMALKLIQVLYKNNFIKVQNNGIQSELSIAEKEQYSQYIDYLDYYLENAENQFSAFRNAKLLVITNDFLLDSLITAFSEYGIKQIHVYILSDHNLPLDLTKFLKPGISVNLIGQSRFMSHDLETIVSEYDHIVFASEYKSVLLLRLMEAVHKINKYFYPLFIVNGKGYVGPLTQLGSSSCINCLTNLLNLDDSMAIETCRNMTFVLAHLLSFMLFQNITTVHTPEIINHCYVVDEQTLDIKLEEVFTHPGCKICF